MKRRACCTPDSRVNESTIHCLRNCLYTVHDSIRNGWHSKESVWCRSVLWLASFFRLGVYRRRLYCGRFDTRQCMHAMYTVTMYVYTVHKYSTQLYVRHVVVLASQSRPAVTIHVWNVLAHSLYIHMYTYMCHRDVPPPFASTGPSMQCIELCRGAEGLQWVHWARPPGTRAKRATQLYVYGMLLLSASVAYSCAGRLYV